MRERTPTSLIEGNAVDYLKLALRSTGRIDPDIRDHDARISWDGDLYYYDSADKFGKKDLAGRIPVQVKGTTKFDLENGMLKYKVSIQDLVNYRQDGGCIFFVVCNSLQEVTIFYEILLPYDLEKILSEVQLKKKRTSNKNNGTTTLCLEQFPSDTDTILALMRTFLSNREKQVSTASLAFDPKKPNERAKELMLDLHNKGISPFSFSLIGTDDKPFERSFDIPTYVYANTPIGIQIPVQRFRLEAFSVDNLPNAVYVNGIKYYSNIRKSEYKDKRIITLGKSTTIELSTMESFSAAQINFAERGTLSERILDYKFWIAICESDKCHLMCENAFEGVISDSRSIEYLSAIRNRLVSLERIKNMLDYYGVYADLDLENLDEKDNKHIDIMTLASLNQELSITIEGGYPVSSIKISNLRISIFVEDLKNGKFKIHNFFDMPEYKCMSNVENEPFETSPYLIMCKQNLIENTNTNYSVMYKSITSKPFVPLYGFVVNRFLLEAVCAYDENRSSELLQFTDKLSEWLLDNEYSEIHLLNRFQILKRIRGITREEQEKLRSIVNSSQSTVEKIGACILLESFLEAHSFWESLSEKEIGQINEMPCFPIFNL